MSAKVSTFGQGVTYVATGETGTQANEFEAAIKSVTSSTDVGAVFLYDTRNDSDGGAWRKKAQGLSWYDETLNTATRGGRREFPSVCLVVADNAAGSETITIYDLDDPAMPMWLVFQMGGANESSRNFSGRAGENANSLFALNGRVMWGINDDLVSGGVCIADFANDAGRRHGTLAAYTEVGRVLSERNSAILPQRMVGGLIVNSTVNDVAATYLEGGELDSLGLVRPVIACASDGGVSVIHPNGTVADVTHSGHYFEKVAFDSSNKLWTQYTYSTGVDSRVAGLSVPYANTTAAASPALFMNTSTLRLSRGTGNNHKIDSIATTSNGLAAADEDGGMTLFKYNDGNPQEGAVAYVTSGYNSGYMLGDIRLALAVPYASSSHGYSNGNTIGDRSVKANNLTTVAASGQQVTAVPVATDAETFAFSNFSATEYLSKDLSSNTDFDFGTGDFSISLWAKNTNWTGDQRMLGRSESTTAKRLSLFGNGTTLTFYLRDGAATELTADVLKNNVWQHVFACRKSSKLYLYVDGRSVATPVDSTTNITPTTASALVIGAETFNNLTSISNPFTNGSLSLVRLSATAPTPQQVKEIYEAEKPLFRAGAKCLLSQVSFNDVNDLAYDNSSDLLYVGTKSGDAGDSVSTFRGLERVDTKDGQDLGWDGASANLVAAAGGVVGYARTGGNGGLIVDLPPFDVRGDTNIADTKLPDDGKLHFSGVTTDATPTVIGNIPIAENERYTVRAKVVGQVYNDNDNSYIDVVEEKIFYREAGSDIGFRTSSYKMTDANHDSFDVEIVKTTGGSDSPQNITSASNLIMIKVTGKSASPSRIVWNATVEVQRITERSYER